MRSVLHRASTVLVLLAFVLLPDSRAAAQLIAAKDGPIVYGHHHLNVSNVDESRKFFVDALGGLPAKLGTTDIVKYPNAYLMMVARKPTGGSKGTTVDHIAFSVPNLRPVLDRVKAGGFRIVTSAEAPANVQVQGDIGVVTGGPVSGIAYVMSPDDMKIELIEMKAQPEPIKSHHVHFTGPQKEMNDWYMQTFGAAAGTSANPAAFISATLPGLTMNFTPAQGAVATRGRVIDHIGFEVKNLEAFVKQLEARGMKLDVAYRSVPQIGLSIAFITDPWGTYIELTEGLDKLN
jgi:catechol 2,3-dioxygenase-like lactoylglutathione lyase family enzyme